MKMRAHFRIPIAVLTLIIVGAIVAAASSGATGVAGQAAAPRTSPAAVYSVFRDAPAQLSSAAAAAAARAQTIAPGTLTVDRSLTRLLTGDDSISVIATAAGDAVCLYVEPTPLPGARPVWASSGCTSLTEPTAAKRPITSTTFVDRGHWRFSALVPDDISELTLETSDGVTQTYEVVRNGVSVETSSAPAKVTWASRNGSGSTPAWSDG